MIHAVVFDTDAPFLDVGVPSSPLAPSRKLAGLTLLRRTILLAWNAGAEAVTVVARDGSVARHWNASEVSLPLPVLISSGQELPELGDEDWVLMLSALVLPRRGVTESLLKAAQNQGCSAVVFIPGASCRGPAVLSGKHLRSLLIGGASLEAVLQSLRPSPDCVQLPGSKGAYRRLDSLGAVRAADQDLYRGLTSITDGYLARVLYRRLSGWITRRIIELPITPNQLTVAHCVLGLMSAFLLWQGSYWQALWGALLLQLSVVLDCSDGEVARLKYQFSKWGSWLDVWADNLVNIAVFAAVADAAADGLGPKLARTLGGVAAVGVGMCILTVYGLAKVQSRDRPGEPSALAVTNRLSSSDQAASTGKRTLVDAVINEATSRDFLVLVVFFALIGRLEWFAWLAAVGSHIFWISFGIIQFSKLRAPAGVNR